MNGCQTCGGFGNRHDAIAHGYGADRDEDYMNDVREMVGRAERDERAGAVIAALVVRAELAEAGLRSAETRGRVEALREAARAVNPDTSPYAETFKDWLSARADEMEQR